jgi:hypothetical protein
MLSGQIVYSSLHEFLDMSLQKGIADIVVMKQTRLSVVVFGGGV